MAARTENNASTWLLAIAELDAAIARAHEIAGRVEAALNRSGTEAKPATDEPAEPAVPAESAISIRSARPTTR